MKTFDTATMRHLDRLTINEKKIPAEILMNRAGNGAAEEIIEYVKIYHSSHIRRFVIITGSGNNGGDGFVIADYLAKYTHKEIIVFTSCSFSEMKSDEAVFYGKKIAESINNLPISELIINRGDMVIDCLLGTGFKGKIKKSYQDVIMKINESGVPVVAIDIPSGLNGDNGVAASPSVIADLTVTIGYPKIGFFKNDGPSHCGILRCVDIGIDSDNYESLLDTVFSDDVCKFFKKVAYNGHKNSRGSVLVIGGSALYGGAPILSSMSALRSGCGICRVVTANHRFSNYPASLIVYFSDNKEGFFNLNDKQVRRFIDDSDSIVIGPGMSDHWRNDDFVENLLSIDKPVVIDAGALNIISNSRRIYKNNGVRVLTPHQGEMERLLKGFGLTKYLKSDRHIQAVKIAEVTGAFIVLKGFRSVVASPDARYRINCSGNSNLATAGSGDCLSGIIASYLNKIDDYFDAITAAVFIHGLVGELSDKGCGMISDDIPSLIPNALRMITKR
ncbi:MAG: NAD(P)H-hydrate dehydratase [Victivallaceae bacterium]|nr:NAD(P)H-hydrate dehydratase [Victivallaceae bacterium]